MGNLLKTGIKAGIKNKTIKEEKTPKLNIEIYWAQIGRGLLFTGRTTWGTVRVDAGKKRRKESHLQPKLRAVKTGKKKKNNNRKRLWRRSEYQAVCLSCPVMVHFSLSTKSGWLISYFVSLSSAITKKDIRK